MNAANHFDQFYLWKNNGKFKKKNQCAISK